MSQNPLTVLRPDDLTSETSVELHYSINLGATIGYLKSCVILKPVEIC